MSVSARRCISGKRVEAKGPGKRSIKELLGIRIMDGDHSGISKHVLETGHSILWEGVKILAYETDWRKRKIKKGIFIDKARLHTLNSKPGVSVSSVFRVLE